MSAANLPSRSREGLGEGLSPSVASIVMTAPPLTQRRVNDAPRHSDHAGGMIDPTLASGRGM